MMKRLTAKDDGVRKLAEELTRSTGVPEAQVVKVLEALGVSTALGKTAPARMKQVEMDRVKRAVREAISDVVM